MLARRQFLMGAAPALLLASRAADAQDKPTIRFVLDWEMGGRARTIHGAANRRHV